MTSTQPHIIPRAEHPVSRRNISPNAIKVLNRLKDNGFISYLVGGCVRDLWLGREPKDFDVVTDATPGQLKRLFRNCRLVGRRFRLAHLHFTDEIIEVATFRSSTAEVEDETTAAEEAREEARPPKLLKSDDGMLLRDNLFGTPEEDARRRDFTVNALCYDFADFSLVDHVGGMADLERGIIRTIGDPQVRFTEDPVRMLRAVRFAALLGFSIEEETWEALLAQSDTIGRAAPPRLYEEVLKLFLSGEGERSYQLLRQTGLFAALFPAFSDWLDTETEGFPHTWVSRALDRVDLACQEGTRPAPGELLALVFGQYLEEKIECLRGAGSSSQQTAAMAVAELLTELAPTITVPQRVGLQIREILANRERFRRMPGKRPQAFIARQSFGASLDYLRFCGTFSEDDRLMAEWWDRYVAGNPAAAVRDGEAAAPGPRPGKPKRRRRRRSGARRTGEKQSPGDLPPPVS
jgi:poly(A) polymerase